MISASRTGKKCLAALLSAAIILTAPGFECYRVLAQEWTGAPTEAGSGKVVEVLQVKPSGQLSPLGAPNASVSTSFGILKPGAVSTSRNHAVLRSPASVRTAASPLTFTQKFLAPSRLSTALSLIGGKGRKGEVLRTAFQQLEASGKIPRQIRVGAEAQSSVISASYDGGGPAEASSADRVLGPGEFLSVTGAISAKRFAWIGRIAGLLTYPQTDRAGVIGDDSTPVPAPLEIKIGKGGVRSTYKSPVRYRSVLLPISLTFVTALLTLHGPLWWIATVGLTLVAPLAAFTARQIGTLMQVGRNEKNTDPEHARRRLEGFLVRLGLPPGVVSDIMKGVQLFPSEKPAPLSEFRGPGRTGDWMRSWGSYVRSLLSFGWEKDKTLYFRLGVFGLSEKNLRSIIIHELAHWLRDAGRAPPSPENCPSWLARIVEFVVSEFYAWFSEFRPPNFKTFRYPSKIAQGSSWVPKGGQVEGLRPEGISSSVPASPGRHDAEKAKSGNSLLERAIEKVGDSLELTFSYDVLLATPADARIGAELLDSSEFNRLSNGKAQLRFLEKTQDGKPASLAENLGRPGNQERFRFMALRAGDVRLPDSAGSDRARLASALKVLDDVRSGKYGQKTDGGRKSGKKTSVPRGLDQVSAFAQRALDDEISSPQEKMEQLWRKLWMELAHTILKDNPAVRTLNEAYQALNGEGRLLIEWGESEPELELMQKLFRYWRSGDGGSFHVERFDRPEGGHVFSLRKEETLAEFRLKAADGKPIKKSFMNAAEGLTQDEVRRRLQNAGFNDGEIEQIFRKTQQISALAFIEAGYKQDRIVRFLEMGVRVQFVLGEDIGQGKSDLIVLVPRVNAKTMVRLAEKEGIGIREVQYTIKTKIRDAVIAHDVLPLLKMKHNGNGRRLGLVDTGHSVAPDHLDYVHRVAKNIVLDVTSPNPPVRPRDTEGHGTVVEAEMDSQQVVSLSVLSGKGEGVDTLITGEMHSDDSPYWGMAYGADIQMVKVFGGQSASDAAIEMGMASNQQYGADGDNASLGGPGPVDGPMGKSMGNVARTPNARGEKPIVGVAAGNEGAAPFTINQLSGDPYVASITAATKPIRVANRLITDWIDLIRMAFFGSVGYGRYSDESFLVPRFVEKPNDTLIGGTATPEFEDYFKFAIEAAKSQDDPAGPSDTPNHLRRRMAGTSQAAPLWTAIAAGDIKSVVLAVTKEDSAARKFFIDNLPFTVMLLTQASDRDLKVPDMFQGSGFTQALAAARLAVKTFGDPSLEATQTFMKAAGLTSAEVRGTPASSQWMSRIFDLMNIEQKAYVASQDAAKPWLEKDETQKAARKEAKNPKNKTTQELLAENQTRLEAKKRRKRGEKTKEDSEGGTSKGQKKGIDYKARAQEEARKRFNEVIREGGDESLLNRVIRLLEYDDPNVPRETVWRVRKSAAFVLSNFRAPEALPALAKAATDATKNPDARMRQGAFMAMYFTPSVSRISAENFRKLEQINPDEAAKLQKQRAEAQMDEADALNTLRDAIKKAGDKTPADIPVYAAFALAAHGDPSEVGRVIDAVKDDRMAKELAETAKNLSPPATTEEILEAAHIKNYGMRKTVTLLLLLMGGVTATEAYKRLVQQGKTTMTAFSDALEALVKDKKEDQDVRHSAAISLGFLGWENPEAISDDGLLTLLQSIGPRDPALTGEAAKAFFILLQAEEIAGRISKPATPLRNSFVAFVEKYKAYSRRKSALGALVRKFADILGIPVEEPPPMPDDQGPGVDGVDPDVGARLIHIIAKPLGAQHRIEKYRDFREPSGVESPQRHAQRFADSRAAAAEHGLDAQFMERNGATLLVELPEFGELGFSLPDHKVESFIPRLKDMGLEAHRAAPVYSLDQEGLPAWASAKTGEAEVRSGMHNIDIGTTGISMLDFKANMEKAIHAAPDHRKKLTRIPLHVAVPRWALPEVERMTARLATKYAVSVVSADPDIHSNGMFSPRKFPFAMGPDAARLLDSLDTAALRRVKPAKPDQAPASWMRRFADIGRRLSVSVGFEGSEKTVLEEMTQAARKSNGGKLPGGYALWLQKWLADLGRSKPDIVSEGPQAILAAFRENFASAEKTAAVRAEADRLLQEANRHLEGTTGTASGRQSDAKKSEDDSDLPKSGPTGSSNSSIHKDSNAPPEVEPSRNESYLKELNLVLGDGSANKGDFGFKRPPQDPQAGFDLGSPNVGLEAFLWMLLRLDRQWGEAHMANQLEDFFNHVDGLLAEVGWNDLRADLQRIRKSAGTPVERYRRFREFLLSKVAELREEARLLNLALKNRDSSIYIIVARAYHKELASGKTIFEILNDDELKRIREQTRANTLWLIDIFEISKINVWGDSGGSPYALRRYNVQARWGGNKALKEFVKRAESAGFGVMTDFVPNHYGLDSDLMRKYPREGFIHLVPPQPEPGEGINEYRNRILGAVQKDKHGRPLYELIETNNYPEGNRKVRKFVLTHHPFAGDDEHWVDMGQIDYSQPVARAWQINQGVRLFEEFGIKAIRRDMANYVANERYYPHWLGVLTWERDQAQPEWLRKELDRFIQDFKRRWEALNGAEFLAEMDAAIRKVYPEALIIDEVYGNQRAVSRAGSNGLYNKTDLYDAMEAAKNKSDFHWLREALWRVAFAAWQVGAATFVNFPATHDAMEGNPVDKFGNLTFAVLANTLMFRPNLIINGLELLVGRNQLLIRDETKSEDDGKPEEDGKHPQKMVPFDARAWINWEWLSKLDPAQRRRFDAIVKAAERNQHLFTQGIMEVLEPNVEPNKPPSPITLWTAARTDPETQSQKTLMVASNWSSEYGSGRFQFGKSGLEVFGAFTPREDRNYVLKDFADQSPEGNPKVYTRTGHELNRDGIWIGLPGGGVHIFEIEEVDPNAPGNAPLPKFPVFMRRVSKSARFTSLASRLIPASQRALIPEIETPAGAAEAEVPDLSSERHNIDATANSIPSDSLAAKQEQVPEHKGVFVGKTNWAKWTKRFVSLSMIPFIYLQIPQWLHNHASLLAGHPTDLKILPWAGYLAGIIGNLILLSFFSSLQEKEGGQALVQAIGVLTTAAVAAQIFQAGFMPAAFFWAGTVIVAMGLSINLLKWTGSIPDNAWKAWNEFTKFLGLFVLPVGLSVTLFGSQANLVIAGGLGALGVMAGVIMMILHQKNKTFTFWKFLNWSTIGAWMATALFGFGGANQLVNNFHNPAGMKNLAASTIISGMAGNALGLAEAIQSKNKVWFVGSAFGVFVAGLAVLSTMYFGGFLSSAVFWPCATLVPAFFLFIMRQNQMYYGHPSIWRSLDFVRRNSKSPASSSQSQIVPR